MLADIILFHIILWAYIYCFDISAEITSSHNFYIEAPTFPLSRVLNSWNYSELCDQTFQNVRGANSITECCYIWKLILLFAKLSSPRAEVASAARAGKLNLSRKLTEGCKKRGPFRVSDLQATLSSRLEPPGFLFYKF